jgi:hypothetical protein
VANSRGYYLRFPCPECGATQKVIPAQVGTEIRCGECPAVIVVPQLDELTAADKAHSVQRKTVGAVRKAPVATRSAAAKPAPPPLELNIVRGHVVSFACPTCHHMMRSTAEELGHVIMCPHCYSPVTVGGENRRAAPVEQPLVLEDTGDDDEYRLAGETPRPAPAIPARLHEDAAEEDEYRLSDEAPRPAPRPTPALVDGGRKTKPAPERAEAPKPRREPAAPPNPNPPAAAAAAPAPKGLGLEERLEQAAKNKSEAAPPDQPFISGVLGFLLYSSAWPRWLALTAGSALVYFLIAGAVSNARDGGAELFFSLLFAIMSGTAALILVFFAAVAFLAVVQDTAAGSDEIEGWPDFNFVDWAGQALYFLNAVAVSAVPGFVLATTILDGWGSLRWAAPAVSAALLYPIVLLSQLDGMSPFSILTPGVLKGPIQSPKAWIAFYAISLLVISAAAAVGWLTVKIVRWDGVAAAVVVGFAVTTALMIEHRLIGRLAWFCEETEPEVEPRAPAVETNTPAAETKAPTAETTEDTFSDALE